jgi:hypothetical protein
LVGILDGPTTPPTALPAGLDWSIFGETLSLWVANLSTGAATHYILTDYASSNTLKLLNLGNNAITTIQTSVGDAAVLVQDTSDRVFLLGGTPKTKLYLYTISTNTLTTLITGASSLEVGNPVGDGTNLYLAEQATGKLYKVPMAASGPSDVVTLLASVPFPLGDPCGGDTVVTTTNNVFLHTFVANSVGGCSSTNFGQDAAGLYRVSKTGGSATAIVPHAVGTAIVSIRPAGNLLYYSASGGSGTSPRANIINENGTSVFSSNVPCYPCSTWSGAVWSPSISIRTGAVPLSKVLLGTFVPGGTWNGVSLTMFDGPTGTQGATLGVVPTTNPTLTSVYGDDFLDATMLLIGSQTGSLNNFVFFVDSALPNSLTQVPTGTAAPWQPAQ